ncbi:Protein F43H9.3 [Aphelenchoides avenae]|nr:Protein F43H9.3 [Aphelenchus avenae]
MLEAIEEHIVNKPKSRLVTIGSMATGLVYDEHSDVDLCLIPEDERFIDDFHTNINGFKRVFMDAVINMLRQLGGKYPELQLQEVIPLYHTYVPLIIARFVNGLSIDIQIPQRDFQALRNTSLIKHYVAVDNRFGQLYNWLRTVCTALGIKHSKDGLLSSYHILLLTVHFLQDKEAHMQNGTAYPVLPVIPQTHPQLVGYNVAISDVIRSVEEPVTEITWTSKNTKSVGELAVELVDYYASFDYSNTAISIRAGNTYKYVQTPPDVHLRIVDPYAAMPVARSRYIARALAMAMEYVRNKMKMGMMIDTFPEFTQESEIFRRNVEFEDWGKKLLSPDDHAL